MSVLICKNVENEGPGTIEDYLLFRSIQYEIVELSKGGRIPTGNDFKTLIIMGGPMSVHDKVKYPFLVEEEKLVSDFVKSGRKVLGICLGAQIMARALGAAVYKGAEEEVGWLDIELSDEGYRDPYMKSLVHPVETANKTLKIKVFHWHGETFDIPASSVRLAGSGLYANQAFKFKENAYAFQFHIEVSKEMIYDWFRNSSIIQQIQNDTERLYDDYYKRAVMFYTKFFSS
jgi:GMP synthase-like glutamine amidotransferase